MGLILWLVCARWACMIGRIFYLVGNVAHTIDVNMVAPKDANHKKANSTMVNQWGSPDDGE